MLIKVNGLRAVLLYRLLLQGMTKSRPYLSVGLMLLAIVALAIFQTYWLRKTFQEEKYELNFRTNVLFREAIQRIEAQKLGLDTNVHTRAVRAGAINMLGVLKMRVHDTLFKRRRYARAVPAERRRTEFFREFHDRTDSITNEITVIKNDAGEPAIVRVLTTVDSLRDSIRVQELSTRYAQLLAQERMDLSFLITRRPGTPQDEMLPPSLIMPMK